MTYKRASSSLLPPDLKGATLLSPVSYEEDNKQELFLIHKDGEKLQIFPNIHNPHLNILLR